MKIVRLVLAALALSTAAACASEITAPAPSHSRPLTTTSDTAPRWGGMLGSGS